LGHGGGGGKNRLAMNLEVRRKGKGSIGGGNLKGRSEISLLISILNLILKSEHYSDRVGSTKIKVGEQSEVKIPLA